MNHGGTEWVVEAFGCEPERLADVVVLQQLFATIVRDLALHPVADGIWHRFPGPGGVTGLLPLAESHLTIHTFPEHGSLCLNLFCCTPRAAWDWQRGLRAAVGASDVRVRVMARNYGTSPDLNDVAVAVTEPGAVDVSARALT